MEDSRDHQQHKPATGQGTRSGPTLPRPRPPGPEQRRVTTGTSTTPGTEQETTPTWQRQLRSPRLWLGFLAVWIVVSFVVPLLFPQAHDRVTVPYTLFIDQVKAGNVTGITSQGDAVQGTFKTAVADPSPPEGQPPRQFTRFDTQIPTFANNQTLAALLEEKGVVITSTPLDRPRSPLLTLLVSFGPTILLIGGFLWISNRAAKAAGGGAFGLGRSRAKRYQASEDQMPIAFADVAGIDEVENELVEIVDFLKEPSRYQRLGGTVPKGVLLIGPPGTGKTLLARAVAGEANVPFFSLSGSEFIEMIVGVGAARVRDLFMEAKKAAPAIIFVDELDAIGRKRGGGNALGGHDEREQTLNQLLVEMDGFSSREAVIVLAATNRADVLDPALLRPGRFDRRVVVQPPDRAGRAAILAVHTRGVPLANDVDLDEIAGETPGLVGADLRNLINEAALLAARNSREAVYKEDFTQALEKISLGAERRISLSPEDRRRVAYHESGHALLGLLQPESDPVRRVTVVARGQSLGVTLSVPDADRYNLSEGYLRARVVSALGGRAAEQVVYGTSTTGAENDFKQVTELARAMVTRWGMSEEVGLLSLEGTEQGNFLDSGLALGGQHNYSEETAHVIDKAVRHIVDDCYARACELLTRERARLDLLADALLQAESLNEDQIRAVTGLDARAAPESPVAAAR